MVDLLKSLQDSLGTAFVVEREIGGGGMAHVFLATETAFGRRVVVKVLVLNPVKPLSAARFKREIQVAAQLRHPHILPVLAAGEGNGILYYTMPYVEGETLRHRLEHGGPLPVDEVVTIVRELSDALRLAHGRGIVHRDIKPENILMDSGHAVVTDFGIAKALGDAGARAGTASELLTNVDVQLGTAAYMAPEQVVDQPTFDHRVDLYALGVVAYELLVGERPFRGAAWRMVAQQFGPVPIPPMQARRPEIPAVLVGLVERLLDPDPSKRPQHADEVIRELETLTVRSVVGQPVRTPGDVAWWRPSPGLLQSARGLRWPVVGALFVLLGVPVALRTLRRGTDAAIPNLVAVAPFTVLDQDLARLWREGIVDVLARNLDGAGSIHTVSPTLVVREWMPGARSDPAGASELAKRTGAQYVVFGNVVPSGQSSIEVTASILDAKSGRVLPGSEVKRGGSRDGIHVVLDSVTIGLLRALGASGVLAEARGGSVGTSSVTALRAFLEGERHYRRAAWDSAIASYERAIAADGDFALALRRIGSVLSWQQDGLDAGSRGRLLHAGTLNHALSRRDSLLVAADSLRASLTESETETTAYWQRTRRLLATLEEARSQYHHDPEVWFALGDAYFHHGFGPGIEANDGEIFFAFERAIELDSAFAPAYLHAMELALSTAGGAAARPYAQRYLALNPGDVPAAVRTVVQLTTPGGISESTLDRSLGEASLDDLFTLWQIIRRWPDSAEAAVHVARYAADLPRSVISRRRGTSAWFAQPETRRLLLLQQLGLRGRLVEASAMLEAGVNARETRLFAELAFMGGIPDDKAAAVFAQWIKTGDRYAPAMLPWFANRRDTASLLELVRRDEARLAKTTDPVGQRDGWYRLQAGRAYIALARGDSADALRLFAQVADTLCLLCYADRLVESRLLIASGRHTEAAKKLDERLWALLTPLEVPFAVERARVAEALGDVEKARRSHEYVERMWAHADDTLRQHARQSQEALARIAARRNTVVESSAPPPRR